MSSCQQLRPLLARYRPAFLLLLTRARRRTTTKRARVLRKESGIRAVTLGSRSTHHQLVWLALPRAGGTRRARSDPLGSTTWPDAALQCKAPSLTWPPPARAAASQIERPSRRFAPTAGPRPSDRFRGLFPVAVGQCVCDDIFGRVATAPRPGGGRNLGSAKVVSNRTSTWTSILFLLPF